MAASAVAIARVLLPIQGPPNGDFALYLIPWMQEVHRLGWASIAGGFSEYAPPYIYVLNLAAWIPNDVLAVKLANVPFIVLLAWGVGTLAGRTAGSVELILPSMLVNAFAIMLSYFTGVGTASVAFLPMTLGLGLLVYVAYTPPART